MPSEIYLQGDASPIWLALPADEAVSLIEAARASGRTFVRLDMVPETRQRTARPAYFDPCAVSAVLPLDPREYEHALDNPPEWAE